MITFPSRRSPTPASRRSFLLAAVTLALPAAFASPPAQAAEP